MQNQQTTDTKMPIRTFAIAGHYFSIETKEDNLLELLPNLTPFVVDEAKEEKLFSATVDNDLIPTWIGTKIGHFPCPSATFDVYRQDNGAYRILVSNEHDIPCAFIVSDCENRNFTIATRGNASQVTFGLNNSLMVIYTLCSAPYRTLLMHSAVVEKGGKGYMFLGASGQGKSTHSNMWVEHIEGSTLINDDNPIVRIDNDGTPIVYGSPWSGKRPIYKNVHYPIGGMAAIEQAKENRIRKEAIPVAFGIMLSSCSTLKFDKQIHMNVCKTISDTLERVPVHTLFCRPDKEAAEVSSKTFGA